MKFTMLIFNKFFLRNLCNLTTFLQRNSFCIQIRISRGRVRKKKHRVLTLSFFYIFYFLLPVASKNSLQGNKKSVCTTSK